MPEELRFHGNDKCQSDYADFVKAVNAALKAGRKTVLNLATIKKLFPCGLLLLMGQVHAWNKKYPSLLTGTYPSVDLVEQMLQEVDVLKQLGLSSRIPTITHGDVKRWQYFTGTRADSQEMASFMQEVQAIVGVEKQQAMYDSVAEAITNVRQHAYTRSQDPTQWWIFATISEDKIVVAIYDRGASIPGTILERPGFADYIKKMILGRKRRDAWIINEAVRGRTSTKLDFRGKGLPEMLESTMIVNGSSLGLYSRNGMFFHNGRGKNSGHKRLDFAVIGTLVMWSLKLKGEQI